MGWGTFVAGGLGTLTLLYGLTPFSVWTMHAFQAGWLLEMLANAVVGIVTGGIVVAVVTGIKKMRGGGKQAAAH